MSLGFRPSRFSGLLFGMAVSMPSVVPWSAVSRGTSVALGELDLDQLDSIHLNESVMLLTHWDLIYPILFLIDTKLCQDSLPTSNHFLL